MPKSTNKLKVGFVIDDGMDQPDGVQQYVLRLGDYLGQKGHEVHYICGETKRTDIAGVVPMSKNLKVKFNGNIISTPLPASKAKIKELLNREKFDVLHVQMPYSPLLAARVIRLAPKGTKIVGTFHVLPVGKGQHFGTKLLGYVLRPSLKKFDKILSVSPPAHDFAKKVFDIDSEVLSNPVDIAKFKQNSKPRDRETVNIVYLGRLVPRKGCMQLLKALDILIKHNPDLKLVINICGDGGQRQKLQNFISSSSLKEKTVMHGFVSETEKIRYLNNADIAVFPSISGESFGIVLIEAMAAGAGVVLAGNNPGYASVMHSVKECLFDPKNPEALAKKIKQVIKKEDFERIHGLQQKLVKKFDINVVGDRILEVYKGL